MSLPRSKSETQIIKTSEDAPNRFDKHSVSYGCDPEIKQMIPDFYHPYHPVKICSYIGRPDKSLLAQELGCELETEVLGIKCDICGSSEHHLFVCEFRERCPWDQVLGKEFEVACLCSNMDCTERCSYPIGRVKYKRPFSYWKF